jgi:hypothetical protein
MNKNKLKWRRLLVIVVAKIINTKSKTISSKNKLIVLNPI